jgi:hypothetical protein
MLKKLVPITTIAILVSILNSVAYANNNNSKFPSVESSVQVPRKRQSVVKHTIRVQIPQEGKNISQLKIIVPPNLKVKNEIRVHDESGKDFATNPIIEGNIITIDIPPLTGANTVIEIDLDRVIPLGSNNIWIYRVIAKFTDGQELNIGNAEIRSTR